MEKQPDLDMLPRVKTESPEPSLLTVPHPRKIWQQLPQRVQTDPYGYERNPAFLFTLNYPYTSLYEVHRFADAVETLGIFTRETFISENLRPPSFVLRHNLKKLNMQYSIQSHVRVMLDENNGRRTTQTLSVLCMLCVLNFSCNM